MELHAIDPIVRLTLWGMNLYKSIARRHQRMKDTRKLRRITINSDLPSSRHSAAIVGLPRSAAPVVDTLLPRKRISNRPGCDSKLDPRSRVWHSWGPSLAVEWRWLQNRARAFPINADTPRLCPATGQRGLDEAENLRRGRGRNGKRVFRFRAQFWPTAATDLKFT